MTFNYINQAEIQNVSLHDATVRSFQYDQEHEVVFLTVDDNEWNMKSYDITFKDIVFVNIENNRRIGSKQYIFDWEHCDISPIVRLLQNRDFGANPKNDSSHDSDFTVNLDDCINVRFYFSTSNQWIITCKEIEVTEKKLFF